MEVYPTPKPFDVDPAQPHRGLREDDGAVPERIPRAHSD